MKNKTKHPSVNLLDNTIIVGFLTLFSYLCTFIFEFGYLGFFGINWSFVSLDISTMIFIITIFCFIFLGLLPIIDFFSLIKLDLRKGVHFNIFINSMLIFYLLIKVLIYQSHYREWIGMAIFSFIYLLSDFLIPLFTKKKQKYIDKINEEYNKELLVKNKTLSFKWMDILIVKYGRSSLVLLILIIVIPLFSYDFGRMYAFKKNHFLSFKENDKQFIVIRNYSNFLLAKSYSGDNIYNELLIKNMDDISMDHVIFEDVPLKNKNIIK